MPIAPPDRDRGGRKTKRPAKRRATAPSTTDRTSPSPRAPAPKKGPPSPQRTGRATRPQPVARKRDAPPKRTDRLADAKRTPEQRARDRAAVDREVKGARRRVVAKRGRGAIPRAVVGAAVRSAQTGSGQGNVKVVHGRRGLPGATIEQADRSSAIGLIPSRATAGLGQALYEDPAGTAKGTLRGGKDALTGSLSAGAALALTLATRPKDLPGLASDKVKGLPKTIRDDYSRRYGPLTKPGREGVAEFVDRVKKEGAFGELADAAILATGTGAAVGRGLTLAAKAERLGSKAKARVTEPRRRSRSTGGGEARDQPLSPNFFAAGRQKRRDEAAFRGQQRTVEKADRKARAKPAEDGERRERGAVRAEVRQATARGEVVPSKRTGLERRGKKVGVRRAPSERKLNRAEKRKLGRDKNQERFKLIADLREEGLAGGPRGAARNHASLDANEKRTFKTALQSGAESPAAGAAWVRARIAKIEAHRERTGEEPSGVDELPILRKILSDPEAHFTPKIIAVMREERERGKRSAGVDHAVADQQAALRRRAPQASLIGVSRRGTPVDRAVREADGRVKARKGAQAKAKTKLERKRRRLAREEGRASLIVAHGRSLSDKTIVRAERAVEIHSRAAANHERRAGRARTENSRKAHEHKAADARDRQKAAQKRLDEARGGREAIRPEYRPRVRAARGAVTDAQAALEEARLVTRDAGKAARDVRGARRRGAKLIDAESPQAFLGRAGEAAKAEGFEEPAYFPSAPRETKRFGLFTVGGSNGATKPDRAYTGKLFDRGTEDGSYQTYANGLRRNFKRAHNWNLVVDSTEEHSIRAATAEEAATASRILGRPVKVDGILKGTPEQLEKVVEALGFDRDALGFFNPGVMREARRDSDVTDEGEPTGSPDELGDGPLHGALKAAQDTSRFAKKGLDSEELRLSTEFTLQPKAILNELEWDTKPSGPWLRGYDIAKGKMARFMLGTSPAWLQIQVASNMLLSAIGGVGPLDVVRMNAWWDKIGRMPGGKELRRDVEPLVGVGHFQDSLDQVKMGAASQAWFVNAGRAFKAHPFWHTPRRKLGGAAVSQLNPLDVLLRGNNMQDNFFRRAMLTNRVKKDAYRRMGENMTAMQVLQDRILSNFKLGPTDKVLPYMQQVLADRRAMEGHVEHLNDFLGDYMSYTAMERRVIARPIMFYGYLRFSLRFAFYTMPVKHPMMTAIIAQLGRMEAEEVRRLLGGDELPWALGRFFFERNGKLQSIDVGRANPVLNQVTQTTLNEGPRGVLRGALKGLPPLYVTLANITFGKSSFEDRDYATGGRNRFDTAEEGITWGQGGRIFAGEMLRLSAIYRSAEKGLEGGAPHGADSLLGDRPTKFKRADTVAGIEESQAEFQKQGGFWGQVKRDMLPLLPRDDFSPKIAEKIREANGTSAAPTVDYSDPAQRKAAIDRAKAAARGAGKMSPEERRAAIARAKAAAGK